MEPQFTSIEEARSSADRSPIVVTLPDGKTLEFAGAVCGADVAAAIGRGLAKAAIAIRLDGRPRDLATVIDHSAAIAVITRDSPEGIEILRHDAAHIMAEAVKELYPDTQVTFGPATETGFYYDFARAEPFTPEDLEKIEGRMRDIVRRDEPITREVWDRGAAIAYFRSIGEGYKAEYIGEIPESEEISVYRQGGFVDLCTGPHLPSTGYLGQAFKLMNVAGAYWRGDPRNAQLQRIYGTAWASQKQLDDYLFRLQEAERRDHRRLGRELDLFHMGEEAVGSVFWHPKGWTLFRIIEKYMRMRLDAAGYQEVKGPLLLDRSLWEATGHWENFRENMFVAETRDDKVMALKPMNCPGHVLIFRNRLRSYRELPLRLAEFGSCHRNEPSGALHGIMRVRGFTQDDAHIFCAEDQVTSESITICQLLLSVFRGSKGRPCTHWLSSVGYCPSNGASHLQSRPSLRLFVEPEHARQRFAPGACVSLGPELLLALIVRARGARWHPPHLICRRCLSCRESVAGNAVVGLQAYRAKRDFGKTREPRGEAAAVGAG